MLYCKFLLVNLKEIFCLCVCVSLTHIRNVCLICFVNDKEQNFYVAATRSEA